jgi:hypothetical protein
VEEGYVVVDDDSKVVNNLVNMLDDKIVGLLYLGHFISMVYVEFIFSHKMCAIEEGNL